ncbi:TPA: hypothetical protein ACH3X2_013568 [Trebouxia sp. C0005]
METQLTFDSKAKQLNLAFKERFVTDSNFQLKITGGINTKTGAVEYQGFLGKFFLAKPRSSSGYSLAADKKQLRIGAGVHYDSVSEQYQVGVTARKNFQLGSSETWLKLSQDALYNPQTQKPSGVGTAQLSKSIFNFTDTQDVRLLVGCNAVINHKGDVVKAPYGQIRENNWSLNTTLKNDWSIRYDL